MTPQAGQVVSVRPARSETGTHSPQLAHWTVALMAIVGIRPGKPLFMATKRILTPLVFLSKGKAFILAHCGKKRRNVLFCKVPREARYYAVGASMFRCPHCLELVPMDEPSADAMVHCPVCARGLGAAQGEEASATDYEVDAAQAKPRDSRNIQEYFQA